MHTTHGVRRGMCRFDFGAAGAVALLAVAFALAGSVFPDVAAAQQMHVGFLGHVHQPIYYPYESVIETEANNRFSFSVVLVDIRDFAALQKDFAD